MRLAHAPQHQLVGLGVVLDRGRSGPRRRAGRAPGTACPRRPCCAPRSRPAAAARASTTAAAPAGRRSTDRVSPVSARVSRPIAHEVAGDDRVGGHLRARRRGRTARRSSRPRRGPRGPVASPKNDVKWPDTCTGLVGGERAGEDADQAEPADVRVAGGLDDLGHERARRGRTRSASAAAPAGVNTSGEGCSDGDGKPRDGEVEQLGAADAGHRADRDDREEASRGRRPVSRSSVSTSSAISSPPR